MQVAHAKATKDAKGMIFNFGFLMFSRIRGTRLRVDYRIVRMWKSVKVFLSSRLR